MKIANELIYSKIYKLLGGQIRFAISGGAPLAKEIGEFFHACDMTILEGYGLTETTAAISVNRPDDFKFGTVGKPTSTNHIKLAADNEILVKGDSVLKCYYKNEKATEEAFVDGYFLTGDIGEWTSDGHLKITDRKKDLIKTSGGKYVAPQRLENFLKLSPYIGNVLIHGDKRKFIVALISLDKLNVFQYASQNGIPIKPLKELSQHPEIQSLIKKFVRKTNMTLSSFESIKKFEILPNEFTIETEELTPSLKVKRKFCDDKYKDVIDSMYGEEAGFKL